MGTDSEVIARLLDHLVRVEGLSLFEAATLLTNPFERQFSPEVRKLLIRYRGARLDGPFAVVAGFCDGNDTYLLALTDRSKFRPLLVGEDDGRFYVASEENQIRNLSKDAVVWAPEPGSFFLASVKKGILEPGTKRKIYSFQSGGSVSGVASAFGSYSRPQRESVASRSADSVATLDSSGVGFSEINEFLRKAYRAGSESVRIDNVSGQRYLGIGFSTKQEDGTRRKFKVELNGYPGNCLANLNDGVSYEVHGNVSDDLADTMHAGSVIIHGSARDVAGQTLQGGHIFVRGSVGNRAGIQMREYKQAKPFFIVGRDRRRLPRRVHGGRGAGRPQPLGLRQARGQVRRDRPRRRDALHQGRGRPHPARAPPEPRGRPGVPPDERDGRRPLEGGLRGGLEAPIPERP